MLIIFISIPKSINGVIVDAQDYTVYFKRHQQAAGPDLHNKLLHLSCTAFNLLTPLTDSHLYSGISILGQQQDILDQQ